MLMITLPQLSKQAMSAQQVGCLRLPYAAQGLHYILVWVIPEDWNCQHHTGLADDGIHVIASHLSEKIVTGAGNENSKCITSRAKPDNKVARIPKHTKYYDYLPLPRTGYNNCAK